MRKSLALALALLPLAAHAEPLTDTRAFDRAFAASFYTFDACGDGKYGALFRQALGDRFNQCGFTPEARAAHFRRIGAQTKKSRDLMAALIEKTGGLPMRLPGMEETCRQQREEPDYQAVRVRLEKYARGEAKLEETLSAPCDADAINP